MLPKKPEAQKPGKQSRDETVAEATILAAAGFPEDNLAAFANLLPSCPTSTPFGRARMARRSAA